MRENYAKAYKEVLEILKHLPQESVDKIPKELIDTLEDKKDVNYNFNIDESRNFEEQILLDETKAILTNIFRDYWATPRQKEIIMQKQNNDRKMIEEQKKMRYDSNQLFQKRKDKETDKQEEELTMEVKKQGFFFRLREYMKSFFRK